jgi:redox-regulated HSP33 family molecular chaperone
MLALLGTVDLDEMIAENKPAEVVCNYCNTRYQIHRPELEKIRARVAPRESN